MYLSFCLNGCKEILLELYKNALLGVFILCNKLNTIRLKYLVELNCNYVIVSLVIG